MKFDEIKDFVTPSNFGVSQWKSNVKISNGVRFALDHGALTESQLDEALAMFENGNFGTAYGTGETPQSQREFGQYKTDLTETEDGFLWVHRENGEIIIYFLFER